MARFYSDDYTQNMSKTPTPEAQRRRLESDLVGIDFAMRLFVGLSARSEGMGKRTRRVYLAVAVLMALICAASVASTAFGVVMEGVDAIDGAFRRTDIIFIQ